MNIEDYYSLGRSYGWQMPRIATCHSGPFAVALILQDPGSPFTSGSGAQKTGEIGVTNGDKTAEFVRLSIAEAGLEISEVLPLNALPGYGLRPHVKSLQNGAIFNAEILKLAKVRAIVLGGAVAQRFRPIGPWEIFVAGHPSVRGRNMARDRGAGFKNAFLQAARVARLGQSQSI